MRYVLITQIPFAITPEGEYAVNELWGWDLKAHLGVCSDLHVFAPMDSYDRNKYPYTFPRGSIAFHPLPFFEGTIQFFMKLPKILFILCKDIQRGDIVHSTATACPPVGIAANILSMLKGCRKRIIVFDADFISDVELLISSEKGLGKKLFYLWTKRFYSFIFRFCISHSPITFVVGDNLYERYRSYGNVIKIYASWMREKDIISPADLTKKMETSQKRNEIKLCFAASLIPKKNPICAIETARILKERGIPFTLHILGEGPMKQRLEELIERYRLSHCVELVGTVPYGAPFYDALRRYDALLAPNLSGEQPRIIFDALANGVVFVGSDIRSFSVISDGENGLLCNPRDPRSFADAVERLYRDKKLVERLVYAGLKTAKENTIESNHRRRMQIINDTSSKRRGD